MNIKITHKWLLEYINTSATPVEIQKYLSLCGPSIESVTKASNDYVYDIEITSNRIDMASVMGIAREASAILPRFKRSAVLIKKTFSLPKLKINNFQLAVADKDGLTNRVLAVIIDGVKFGPSPQYIKERLEASGIRSLNNLVDITNYVMLEIGHPTHVFDYDRIKTGKLIFRKALKGEKLVTLDEKSFVLNGGEAVIDDGTGRIVDLPSIMGTENSVVTASTNRIIFFIDNLNPQLIRRASMTHGIRTLAATYNEKNPDPELGLTALFRGIELLKQFASPQSMSRIIDIFTKPVKPKEISVSIDYINSHIGVKLPQGEIVTILKSLEFKVVVKSDTLLITPPSFRSADVTIPEDIVEEVARIYGYHNLPNNIQPTVYIKQPKDIDLLFEIQSKVKHFLKNIGMHEVMNYSMISEKMIAIFDLEEKDHLRLQNPISEDISHLRRILIPSLVKNVKENEGKSEELKFFEIAKTYKPQNNDLPVEMYKLGIVVNTSLADLKGLIDALCRELNIVNYHVTNYKYHLFDPHKQGKIIVDNDDLAEFGKLHNIYKDRMKLKSDLYIAVFFLPEVLKYYKGIATYHPINPYAIVKLDLTIVSNPKQSYEKIKKLALETSPLLQKMELVDTFKNKLNLRFYFSLTERNITEEEAKKELEKIKKHLT